MEGGKDTYFWHSVRTNMMFLWLVEFDRVDFCNGRRYVFTEGKDLILRYGIDKFFHIFSFIVISIRIYVI